MAQSRIICVFAVAVVALGCGGPSRNVKRLSTNTTTDISGNWNDSDARMTSEALIKQCFGAAWLKRFKDEEGRSPVVRVRRIVNKTDEHIDAQVFVKNIERAMVNGGAVDVLAQEGAELESVNKEEDYGVSGRVGDGPSIGNQQGADFVLVGRLASILDQHEGVRAKLYKVTFELIHAESGKKAWIGDHEIKKLVTQDSASW